MHPFEEFLHMHQIEALQLAMTAGVRYFTVWNAMKGKMITPEHAGRIRKAAQEMAGVPYTGPFVIAARTPVEQMPKLHAKRMTTHL